MGCSNYILYLSHSDLDPSDPARLSESEAGTSGKTRIQASRSQGRWALARFQGSAATRVSGKRSSPAEIDAARLCS